MIQQLLQFDSQIFLLISHLPHNFFLHSFFASISGIGSWGLIWILFAIILFFWEKAKNPHKLVSLILAVVISWISVEWILKNLIHRTRPEMAIAGVVAVSEISNSYSFPSLHATIAFAGAYLLGQHHEKLRWFYYLLAVLIAFSRVYLGKHYPSDVVVGAILGLLIGVMSDRIIRLRIFSRFFTFSR